jgi:hypothetical protein
LTVAGRERKYALDSNLFLDGFRDADARRRLDGFHAAFAPFEHLSAVVAHELSAGVQDPRDRQRLAESLFAPFVRRNRVFAPSPAAWRLARRSRSQQAAKAASWRLRRAS